jgi:uncharacterized protein YdbL (DUF1318 family)
MRISLFALLLLCAACSIKAPEVRVVGQRSLLEKQILGSYESSVQDQWIMSLLRSDSLIRPLPDEELQKKSLLRALRRRRFNQDDRVEFLHQGFLGETFWGELVQLQDSLEPNVLASLNRLVTQENTDRRVLLSRLRLLHPADTLEIQRVFTQIQQDSAPRGSMIQNEAGQWSKRP